MFNRTANVHSISINSLGSSSCLQIGDSIEIHNVTHALAVQRERELFFENEGDLRAFSIFNRLQPLTPSVDDVEMQTTSLHPIIKVGKIDVLALSSSAILHIGNSEHIQSETRIKHIRQVETVGNQSEQNTEEE
jgi:spore germination protein PE